MTNFPIFEFDDPGPTKNCAREKTGADDNVRTRARAALTARACAVDMSRVCTLYRTSCVRYIPTSGQRGIDCRTRPPSWHQILHMKISIASKTIIVDFTSSLSVCIMIQDVWNRKSNKRRFSDQISSAGPADGGEQLACFIGM